MQRFQYAVRKTFSLSNSLFFLFIAFVLLLPLATIVGVQLGGYRVELSTMKSPIRELNLVGLIVVCSELTGLSLALCSIISNFCRAKGKSFAKYDF